MSWAEFVVVRGDGYADINAAPETLGEFQAFELARGVPLHDLAQRLIRLAREAGELLKLNHFTNMRPLWREENRSKSAKVLFLI